MTRRLDVGRRIGPLAMSLLAVFGMSMSSPSIVSAADAPGARPVEWRSLRYKATKLFMTATSDVRLTLPGRDTAARALQPCPHGDCTPLVPKGQTAAIALDTSFVGRRSTETIWFDAIDGRSLQREKRKHGSSGYAKLYRFGEYGIGYRRSEPGRGEESYEPARWTDASTHWIAEPTGTRGCPIVSPAALFYLLSAYPWQNGPGLSGGDGFEICVFTNKDFSRLSVRRVGTEIVDGGDIEGLRSSGKIEAIAVDLVADTFDGSDPTEQFELMGLEGDIRMLLDPSTGIPLKFRGDLSSLGEVEVELERIGFK